MTFKVKYLVDDQYFNSKEAKEKNLPRPILFYAGNEAAVEVWANFTGYQSFALAKKYGGLVVYLEHRYFGESMPFGEQSLAKGNVQYSRLQNTLMDMASTIQHIRGVYNAEKSPAVAFGGSYGGELATWLRMKFPSIIQAAVNSGGPVLYYKGSPDVSPNEYDQWEQRLYDHIGEPEAKECGKLITEGLDQLLMLKYSPHTFPEVERLFHNSCIKNDGKDSFPDRIYTSMWGELWELPARNPFTSTVSFSNPIPDKPVWRFCQGFKDIKPDPSYKLMANNEQNRPEGINLTQTVLTDRQRSLFVALDRLEGLTTNYTGNKDCDKPMSVTDPKMAKMLSQFPEGWNALTCTSTTNPL